MQFSGFTTKINKLRFLKWSNMFIFFLINLFVIILVSVIRVDQNALLYNPRLSFNVVYAFNVVIITFLMQLLFLYGLGFSIVKRKGVYEIYPKIEVPKEIKKELQDIGISIDEIVNTIREVCTECKKDISRIYLSTQPVPNAFTLDLPFLGSAININKNLLYLLEDEELKTAFAHEIGHIKEHDSLLKLLFASPSTFLNIAFLYLYILLSVAALNSLLLRNNILEAIIRGVILVIVYLISKIFVSIVTVFLQNGQRNAEFLADIHASRITAPKTAINMLIQLGQRSELLTKANKYFDELHKDKMTVDKKKELLVIFNKLPYEKIQDYDKQEIKALCSFIIAYHSLVKIKENYKVPLQDHQIKDLSIESAYNINNIKLDEELVVKIKQNGSTNNKKRLDDENIHTYIDSLYSNPDKLAVRIEKKHSYEHPLFRERIINLYDYYYPDSEKFH